jgi:hypothetical protein
MTKESIKLFLSKKIVRLSIIGFFIFIVGLFIGYELRGYMIRSEIRKAFSEVSQVSESKNGNNSDKVAELETGQSFEDNGLTLTVLEVQRSDTDITLSDNSKRDSKVGFKVRVENKTTEDKYFNSSNFSLKSRVDDNQIAKVDFYMGDNKNFSPEIESNSLIDGAVLEGWFTYFLPKNIQNSDLQIVYNGDVKVKYKLK